MNLGEANHQHKETLLKIRQEIKLSISSQVISLPFTRLFSFPREIIDSSSSLQALRRLDLSFNHIRELPAEIEALVGLRELWLQGNPLIALPKEIEKLKKIEVIDIKRTEVQLLPPEMCNLRKLHDFDFSETPFAKAAEEKYSIRADSRNGLQALKRIFEDVHTREKLKASTVEKLLGELYVKEADSPQTLPAVEKLLEMCNEEFTNLEEFRLFCRRADKLLPGSLAEVDEHTISRAKEKFLAMRDSTKRDRMAAEVEIKIRNIYFDRIERSDVESVIHSIFQHVAKLEDMQFLVKYASQVFPPSPGDAEGALIWKNILRLQGELTDKREAAVNNLISAMGQLYPEQLPDEVASRGREIAKCFQKERFATKRELNSLSRLAADAVQIFPPDFVSASATEVFESAKQVFRKG